MDLFLWMLSLVLFTNSITVATAAPVVSTVLGNGTLTAYQCTNRPSWSTKAYRREDCYLAVTSKAFNDELSEFHDEPIDFYSSKSGGIGPSTPTHREKVPRKFVFGK